MEATADAKAFLKAIGRHVGNAHVAPGAAPGCPECLPILGKCSECGHTQSLDSLDAPSVMECEDCGGMLALPSAEDWHDLANEGGFSRSPCDTCGSRLGGNRYPAHLLPEDAEPIHVEVCTDCLMFFANGDVPETWA